MNLENKRKLANEAINLLKEFAEIQDQHRENSFNKISDTNTKIIASHWLTACSP